MQSPAEELTRSPIIPKRGTRDATEGGTRLPSLPDTRGPETVPNSLPKLTTSGGTPEHCTELRRPKARHF
jgi:hypothetical protein